MRNARIQGRLEIASPDLGFGGLSGLDYAPDGSLVAVAAADLLPGRTIDGRVIAEADMRHQIDNMEDMALSAGTDGETIITLISDDNNSIIQRTILLQFRAACRPPANTEKTARPRPVMRP